MREFRSADITLALKLPLLYKYTSTFYTSILQNSDIMKAFLSFVLLLICPLSVFCDNDDICLWLRFDHAGVIAPASVETRDIEMLDNISLSTVTIAANELRENWTGVPVTLQIVEDALHKNGYFKIEKRENDLMEGPQDSPNRIYITAGSASGLLYGAYFILRSQAMGDGCLCKTLGNEDVIEQEPAFSKRLVQIDVNEFPEQLSLKNFARACASIGINGIVLTGKSPNNIKEIKDIFAPYHIELLNNIDSQDITTIDIRQNNSLHLQYLAPLWQIPTPDTNHPTSAILGVIQQPSSITQHPFSSLNLYAFGRMAWMPQIIKERVAFEWLAQTFTENPLFVIPMRDVLMKSTNPTPADIENFVSIWHQMSRTIDSQQHSIVEEILNRQFEDSLE